MNRGCGRLTASAPTLYPSRCSMRVVIVVAVRSDVSVAIVVMVDDDVLFATVVIITIAILAVIVVARVVVADDHRRRLRVVRRPAVSVATVSIAVVGIARFEAARKRNHPEYQGTRSDCLNNLAVH